MFKSGSDLYNADLDDEQDTVSFYNCSMLPYNATYNIPNTDSSVSVRALTLAPSFVPVGAHSPPCLTLQDLHLTFYVRISAFAARVQWTFDTC